MHAKTAVQMTALMLVLGMLAFLMSGGANIPPSSAHAGDPAVQLAEKSRLPVISITTAQAATPGEENEQAILHVYQMKNGKLHAVSSPIAIRERGNTSRRFPKKSYRVIIQNEKGEKSDLSLLGMRSDDDWILNPLYTDTSKIREAMAYALWEEINTSGGAAESSRMAYAEVFINGEYRGLYGVQERIDRKQVNADKRSGVLYKIIANDRPDVQELLACESDEICRGFELSHAGAGVLDPWAPAAAYMALLEGEESPVRASLSLDNAIDYGLWAMLCQAHDCHFKNQFLNCVYGDESYTMYKIPWDLNNTFGDVWQSAAEDANYTGYHIGSLVIDDAFGALLDTGDPAIYEAVRRRWSALRSGFITEENLIDMAHALHNPLIEAIERDSARWPSGGMGNGNAANIRDIQDYIRETIPKMDAFIFGPGEDERPEE